MPRLCRLSTDNADGNSCLCTQAICLSRSVKPSALSTLLLIICASIPAKLQLLLNMHNQLISIFIANQALHLTYDSTSPNHC